MLILMKVELELVFIIKSLEILKHYFYFSNSIFIYADFLASISPYFVLGLLSCHQYCPPRDGSSGRQGCATFSSGWRRPTSGVALHPCPCSCHHSWVECTKVSPSYCLPNTREAYFISLNNEFHGIFFMLSSLFLNHHYSSDGNGLFLPSFI